MCEKKIHFPKHPFLVSMLNFRAVPEHKSIMFGGMHLWYTNFLVWKTPDKIPMKSHKPNPLTMKGYKCLFHGRYGFFRGANVNTRIIWPEQIPAGYFPLDPYFMAYEWIPITGQYLIPWKLAWYWKFNIFIMVDFPSSHVIFHCHFIPYIRRLWRNMIPRPYISSL